MTAKDVSSLSSEIYIHMIILYINIHFSSSIVILELTDQLSVGLIAHLVRALHRCVYQELPLSLLYYLKNAKEKEFPRSDESAEI